MSKVAVTYSPVVGGSSVISLKKSFEEVGSKVVDADYSEMMKDIPEAEFKQLYSTREGRETLFAHAKAQATEFLKDIDCLVLSGSAAMVDPELFNQAREEGQSYNFTRTISELALVHVATQKGMPILGICGGHQVIAVHGGGEVTGLTSDELKTQGLMDYEKAKINNDSMLAKIVGGKDQKQDVIEEFFGAHTQKVSKLAEGFEQTATSSDQHSIEAAEKEHGAPVITTQFHPEVSVKGMPESEFMYKKSPAEAAGSLRIFEYLDKAGETFSQKRAVMEELKSAKPVKAEAQKQNASPKNQPLSPESEFDSGLRNVFGTMARSVVSFFATSKKVSELEDKEKLKTQQMTGEHSSSVKFVASEDHKAPHEVLRDTPSQLWKKPAEEVEDQKAWKVDAPETAQPQKRQRPPMSLPTSTASKNASIDSLNAESSRKPSSFSILSEVQKEEAQTSEVSKSSESDIKPNQKPS